MKSVDDCQKTPPKVSKFAPGLPGVHVIQLSKNKILTGTQHCSVFAPLTLLRFKFLAPELSSNRSFQTFACF